MKRKRFVSIITVLCILSNFLYVEAFAETDAFVQNENGVTYQGNNHLTEELLQIKDAAVASDMTVSYKLTLTEGNSCGTLLRYVSDNKHYLMQFQFAENRILFLKKLNVGKYTRVSEVSYPLNRSETYDIGIICLGSEFELYINNEAVTVFSDSGITGGTFGFYATSGSWSASEIKAESLAGVQGNSASSSAGSFGLPEEFAPIKNGTTKEVFEQLRAEVPTEIPIKNAVDVYGDCEIFVAPNGDDNNGNGSIDKPFATLKQAMTFVDYYKKLGRQRIVIYLRGGAYTVSDAVTINSSNSGTEENPLIISAYQDEEVSFVGGYTISGTDFHQITDQSMNGRLRSGVKDSVMVADLKAMGITEYGSVKSGGVNLYADGEKMTLARYPNSGEVTVGRIIRGCADQRAGEIDDGNGFEFEVNDSRVLGWKNTGDLWMYGSFDWQYNRGNYQIRELNPGNRSIVTVESAYYGARSSTENTYYYYNVFEEIDSPGEWYLDRAEGKLYFYPYRDIDEMEFQLSVYSSDLLNFDHASNVVVNGINFTVGSKNAISMTQSDNCMIQNCTISNIGKNALYLDRCTECGIIGSTIYAFGEGGLYITSTYRERLNYLATNVRACNFAQNNFIYNTSVDTDEALIWTRYSMGDIISHNLISHSAKYGIRQSISRNSIIEFNELCGGPNSVADMGAIYTGSSRNYHVSYRNNYIHDMSPEIKKSSVGIYLDELGSFYNVYNNLMVNCPKGIFTHTGRRNSFVNNIVIYEPGSSLTGAGISDSQNHFTNDTSTYNAYFKELDANEESGIWYDLQRFFGSESYQKNYPDVQEFLNDIVTLKNLREEPDYERGALEDRLRTAEYNYYKDNLTIGGHPLSISEKGLPTAIVENNVDYDDYTDPGFYDMKNRDFRIKDDAEVYTKIPDFKDIQFERMGLVQEKGMWNKLPSLTPMTALAPMNNGKCMDGLESVLFKWTHSIGAEYYQITIANDPDFQDVVCSATTIYPFYTAKLAESDHEYFWRVEAVKTAKSLQGGNLMSDTWSFKTMTEDELSQYISPDTYSLELLIGDAENLYNNITEGGNQGDYKRGTKESLKAAIRVAETAKENAKKQSQVDEARNKLQVAIDNAKSNVNSGFVYFDDFDPEHWSTTVVNAQSRFKPEGDGLKIEASYGETVAYTGKKTGMGDIYCFKMKVNDFSQWMGILPRWDYLNSAAKYWYILKPDQLELQQVENRVTTFLGMAENNPIFKTDVWHEVQIGSVATEKGIWNLLIIDGVEIFNYLDADNSVYGDGWLCFTVNSNNGDIYLEKSDKTYTKLPEMPSEPGKPVK